MDEKAAGSPMSRHVDNAAVEHAPVHDPVDVASFTEAEKAQLIRKLDGHLLPLLWVLYSLSVLDRSNLGNARIAGLEDDIDLSGWRYNWLGTTFYIAYILFQWTIVGWKVFRPHRWATIVVLFWGFMATIQASIHNWEGLMACRFFLGVGEAMFGPGVPFYLSFFYARDKVGFRHGVFISGSAMANAYGGALGYAISHIHSAVRPWQILFIIEGLPTCLIAVLAWFYLPDSIASAKFLSDREKALAIHMVAQNQKVEDGAKTGLKFSELLDAFKDPKTYVPPVMYFSCNVCFASLPLFLPTIIAEIGTFSRIQSNGLSAPPYLLCFFMILLLTFLSDRFQKRGPFCATAALIAAIGFITQATTKNPTGRYIATFLSVQIFCSVALLLAWTANMHATESKRAGGYAILATVGQCGPLVGTNIFPEKDEPYYHKGLWISAGFCLLVFILSIALSLVLIWENRKIDRAGLSHELETELKDASPNVAVEVTRYRHIW